MKLTVLGAGGWIPTEQRQTSSYLITHGSEALILDAGTGLGRLHRFPELLDGIDTVTLALSHFHLDHVAGLTYVSPRWMGDRELTIFGPGRSMYSRSTEDIVNGQLVAQPIQTASPVASARWAEMGRDRIEFAGAELDTWKQDNHTLPSAGMRLGDHLAYCTDTEFDTNTISRVRGARTLLHEAWEPVDCEQGHTSGHDAGRIAIHAGAQALILTHLHPVDGIAERTLRAAREVCGHTNEAVDGEVTDLLR